MYNGKWGHILLNAQMMMSLRDFKPERHTIKKIKKRFVRLLWQRLYKDREISLVAVAVTQV